LNQKLSFEALDSIFRLSLVEKSPEIMTQWTDLFFFCSPEKWPEGRWVAALAVSGGGVWAMVLYLVADWVFYFHFKFLHFS
jgi:hypothetical protein